MNKSDWLHLDFLFGNDELAMMDFLRELGHSFDSKLEADKIAFDLLKQGYESEPDPFFDPLYKINEVISKADHYSHEIKKSRRSLGKALKYTRRLRSMITELSLISD